jgi:hypothetical protein
MTNPEQFSFYEIQQKIADQHKAESSAPTLSTNQRLLVQLIAEMGSERAGQYFQYYFSKDDIAHQITFATFDLLTGGKGDEIFDRILNKIPSLTQGSNIDVGDINEADFTSDDFHYRIAWNTAVAAGVEAADLFYDDQNLGDESPSYVKTYDRSSNLTAIKGGIYLDRSKTDPTVFVLRTPRPFLRGNPGTPEAVVSREVNFDRKYSRNPDEELSGFDRIQLISEVLTDELQDFFLNEHQVQNLDYSVALQAGYDDQAKDHFAAVMTEIDGGDSKRNADNFSNWAVTNNPTPDKIYEAVNNDIKQKSYEYRKVKNQIWVEFVVPIKFGSTIATLYIKCFVNGEVRYNPETDKMDGRITDEKGLFSIDLDPELSANNNAQELLFLRRKITEISNEIGITS